MFYCKQQVINNFEYSAQQQKQYSLKYSLALKLKKVLFSLMAGPLPPPPLNGRAEERFFAPSLRTTNIIIL